MQPTTEALADYCLAAILRCHRSPQGGGWASVTPRVDEADREELLLRWALSADLKRLATAAVGEPRRIRSAVAFETQMYSGSIPGAVDAHATLMAQELSGDSTLFVVNEPSISPLTRRNHVLAWVLREASLLIASAIRRHRFKAELAWIHDRAVLFEQATRLPLIREVMASPMGRRRPGAAEVRDAGNSMSPMYQRAALAMTSFEAVERLSPAALRALLSDTLIARLEDWQRLELAAALGAADALAAVTGEKVHWKGSITGGTLLAKVGSFSIHWQNTLPKRSAAQLDPSEDMAINAVEALDARLGPARADISVRVDGGTRDVAHLECKWFASSSSASSAISGAVTQLVRYCRDSRPSSLADAALLLKDSFVVCSHLWGYGPSIDGSKPVGLTDYAGMISGSLADWAARLSAREPRTFAA